MKKLKLTTVAKPEAVRRALQEILGHNGDKLLLELPPPPPTITAAHWQDKEWKYIPSTDHVDATKFRERMEKRRIAVQGK